MSDIDRPRPEDGILFNFAVSERVQTGDGAGLIMLADSDENGKMYLINTSVGETWYREEEILALGPEIMPVNERYLTEEKS